MKERGAEILEKSVRPPSCVSPLKITSHLVQLLAIIILIAIALTVLSEACFTNTSLQRRKEQIRSRCQWRNELLINTDFVFFCRKGRNNAPKRGKYAMMPVSRLYCRLRDETSAKKPRFSYPYDAMISWPGWELRS